MISILLIIAIFFLSAASLQELFLFFHRKVRRREVVIFVIALLYLPGTVVHELSHYIVALILNLHPREISFFPVTEGARVRLGHVLFEKEKGDFVRPLLVGIAPLLGGLAVLWLFTRIHLNGIVLWYLVWSVTANMFSSKQDLVDLIYVVPVVLLVGLILYLFPLSIPPAYEAQILHPFLVFLDTLQPVLLFSAAIHAILVVSFIGLKQWR